MLDNVGVEPMTWLAKIELWDAESVVLKGVLPEWAATPSIKIDN